MGLQDFITTPIFLILIFFFAYLVRSRVSDKSTKKYFIPALALKIMGAISVGLIYQFYYSGGDTFNYWTRGSKWIWLAFLDNPSFALKLLLSDGTHYSDTFQYSQHILFYSDPASYFVVRLAAIFDIFTFHTYSATAALFAVFSFSGLWALFMTLKAIYPKMIKHFAIALFFVPSVVFWGSGILKDSITLSALSWLTFSFYRLVILRQFKVRNVLILVLASYTLLSVKIYIMLAAAPAFTLWGFLSYYDKIQTQVIKYITLPFFLLVIVSTSYLIALNIGELNEKYALDTIAETAKITAYDIRYWTGRNAGSHYTIGELDGTLSGMIQLAPQAINVALFRPYLWEVNNPLMLLMALESMFFLYITVKGLFSLSTKKLTNPFIMFCLVFSVVFAFAVGISTFNFGSLVRYRIPLIPFYLCALFLINKPLNFLQISNKGR